MTCGALITKVRSRSRTDADFFANSEIQDLLNEGLDEFAKDVHGLRKETFLALSPLFDTATHFAIRLTVVGGANVLVATDIVITAAAASNITGTAVATALQIAIRAAGCASLTVAWSTTAWTFTIDAIDSTSITIGAPSSILYADATPLLFNTSGTQTGTTWTGNIPRDVNLEIALPEDFLELLEPPEWNGAPLTPATWDLFTSPQSSGTPNCYYVYQKRLRISPVPTSQGMLRLWYRYLPAQFSTATVAYQECGLTGKTGGGATGLSTTTPYYFKLTIDNGEEIEYTITTADDATYAAVIILMNAEISGATFAISGGDLRCTSDNIGADGYIGLAAGATGTDLFATLTDFTAFETAESELLEECDALDREYQMALVYYAAGQLCDNEDEEEKASKLQAQYFRLIRKFLNARANQNPKYRQHVRGSARRPFTVTTRLGTF